MVNFSQNEKVTYPEGGETDHSATERRSFPRGEVLLSGSVKNEFNYSDCAVMDISFSGARFQLDQPLKDAKQAEAIRFSSSTNIPIEVSWINNLEIGVRFLISPLEVAGLLETILPRNCFS